MPKRSAAVLAAPLKRARYECTNKAHDSWADWPAPRSAMYAARAFLDDVIQHKRSVLIVPDKDADGLSAGTLLCRTLMKRGLPPDKIFAHHLFKGNNVHCDAELARMTTYGAERVVVLDQGSRPGRALLPGTPTLIIDHHMADQWPEDSTVLSACHSPPIATTSLLTYCLLSGVSGDEIESSIEDWRAVIGVYGDLGPSVAKWGEPPWPSELQETVSRFGSKVLLDAVAAINAPRRTAEYDVPRAWQILLEANGPREISSNAFLKLCKLDVADETSKWARTAPKFSEDGRVAVVEINSGFQIHPVIATRWAGTLGRRSEKLEMVMCANTGFNPDPNKVSFSCRIPGPKKNLPEEQRPDLIELLRSYGDTIPGFNEQVGSDFARGHKEATGGIIPKSEFARLVDAMGIGKSKARAKKKSGKESTDQCIGKFFKPQNGTDGHKA